MYNLDLDEHKFTIDSLNALNILFYKIRVTPKTLEMLNTEDYEFPEECYAFAAGISLYYDNKPEEDTNDHFICFIQRFNDIKKVFYQGQY